MGLLNKTYFMLYNVNLHLYFYHLGEEFLENVSGSIKTMISKPVIFKIPQTSQK